MVSSASATTYSIYTQYAQCPPPHPRLLDVVITKTRRKACLMSTLGDIEVDQGAAKDASSVFQHEGN